MLLARQLPWLTLVYQATIWLDCLGRHTGDHAGAGAGVDGGTSGSEGHFGVGMNSHNLMLWISSYSYTLHIYFRQHFSFVCWMLLVSFCRVLFSSWSNLGSLAFNTIHELVILLKSYNAHLLGASYWSDQVKNAYDPCQGPDFTFILLIALAWFLIPLYMDSSAKSVNTLGKIFIA